MAKRPSVNTNCVADNYAASAERIIEVSDTTSGLGALVSLLRGHNDNHLSVSVYRADPGVSVVSGPETPTFVDGIEVNPLVRWWKSLTDEQRAATGVDMHGESSSPA